MSLSIIGTIPNLLVNKDHDNFKISDFNIVNSGFQIDQVHNFGIEKLLGTMQFKEVISVPCFYLTTDPTDIDEIPDMLSMVRGIFESVLFSFWLVKDNSLHLNLILGITNSDFLVNRSPRTFTNSEGEYRDIAFSEDEIKEAGNWFNIRKINQSSEKKKTHKRQERTLSRVSNVITHTEKNLTLQTRLDRAIRFVLEARGQSFLPAKITFYISALESLLSNSNVELRMQVADRGSRILGNSFEERVKINEIISIAYSFRSTYIHGSAKSEKSINKILKPFNNLEGLLSELDDILRRIIKEFLTDLNHVVNMNDKEFSVWVNELLYK
ncbi:hypothetical protein J7E55_11900 [Bacillus sp. ISL-53]|nr:hypothetical protein [Bacillus sp. ISL-53]